MFAMHIPNEHERNQRLKVAILEINFDRIFGELELPIIWITKPFYDLGTEQVVGRVHIDYYTPDSDDSGWNALRFGAEYYEEGFNYVDSADKEKRIDCFKAAEIFYLHSAQLGNIQAFVNLGYIYSYNRCEGRYFEFLMSESWEMAHADAQEYPFEDKAFEYFTKAHELGSNEAAYKLGDLYSRGIGCEVNLPRAFELYLSSYENGKNDESYIWGSAAYRLAGCYENAKGCDLSFAKALEYYVIAEIGLSDATKLGLSYYEKNLSNTRKAIKRLNQEISGRY
jgi:TPR repeat protein